MEGDYNSREKRRQEVGFKYGAQPVKARVLGGLNDSLGHLDLLRETYQYRTGPLMSEAEQEEFEAMIEGLQGIVEKVYLRTDKGK